MGSSAVSRRSCGSWLRYSISSSVASSLQCGVGVVDDTGGESSGGLSDRDVFEGGPDEEVGETIATEERTVR